MLISDIFFKLVEYGLYILGVIAIVGFFFGCFGSLFVVFNIGRYFWKTQDSGYNHECELRDYQRANTYERQKEWDAEVSIKVEKELKQQQATKQIWVDVKKDHIDYN